MPRGATAILEAQAIEHITSLATAKQWLRQLVADRQRLERENARLRAQLQRLQQELAQTQAGAQDAAEAVAQLTEQNAQMKHRIFGTSSERRPPPEAPAAAPPRRPRRGHGPRPQPALPCEERIHEVPAAERICHLCGAEMTSWPGAFEEAEEITVVPRRYVRVLHKRQKYRCRCNGSVRTAPGPRKLLPGGRYSLALVAEVAVDKYADHLPLDRQRRRMGRAGLELRTSTLWDQLDAAAQHLAPTYNALGDWLWQQPYLHVDETTWRLLLWRQRWYLWCVGTAQAAFFWLRRGRDTAAARDFLDGYQGSLLVDGYTVYQSLALEQETLRLAYCWAHVRRKFLHAERAVPGPCRQALDWIGQIYHWEGSVPDPDTCAGETRAAALVARQQVRNTHIRPLVEALHAWALTQPAEPGSTLRKALDYLCNLWPGLVRFLADPHIPLDNNRVERTLRTPVLGRKSHLGSRSVRGTEVAALFYSLIGTALLAEEEPCAYLVRALTAAIEEPGCVTLPKGLGQ